MYIDYFLETFPRARPWHNLLGRDNNACSIRALHIDWSAKFAKNCTKHFSNEMNTFLHWRQAFTRKDFQMHQQSLDHSYCKRETWLTKLKNSKSMMILVVRLASSPIWSLEERCKHKTWNILLYLRVFLSGAP
jgi:hypothetical protein